MLCRYVCAMGLLGVLNACAAGPVERHRLADGSWQITCQLPMDECVRRIEPLCNDKRYRIVTGESKNIIRDVPPGTREYRTSELTLLCTDQLSAESASAGTRSEMAPTLSRLDGGSPMLCVPGATQACLGPAGCQGGQACRPDGSGFGACDCGTAKASPDAGF
jgi:hypothetical protein